MKRIRKIFVFLITAFLLAQILPWSAIALTAFPPLTRESMGLYILTPMQSFSSGRAGIIKYNEYSQEVIVCRDEVNMQGGTLPVNIKRYYHSYPIQTDIENSYGDGWHTNYNVKLMYRPSTDTFSYCREDGSLVSFERSGKIEDGYEKWTEVLDRLGPRLDTLWLPIGSRNLAEARVLSVSGQVQLFDAIGRLNKITLRDVPKGSVSVSYYGKSDRIHTIRDDLGRIYSFQYQKGLLSDIICLDQNGDSVFLTTEDGTSVALAFHYQYKQGRLVGVEYPDGESVDYFYGKNKKLSQITNVDQTFVTISYKGDRATEVREQAEDDAKIVTKSVIRIDRQSENEILISDQYGQVERKTFDQYGLPIQQSDPTRQKNRIEGLPKHQCNNSEKEASSEQESFSPSQNSVKKGIVSLKKVEKGTDTILQTVEQEHGAESYQYEKSTGLLEEYIDAEQHTTYYDYDAAQNLVRETLSVSGLTNAVSISNQYDFTQDRIKTVTHNGFSYNFDYTTCGNLERVSIGDAPYVVYDYDKGEGMPWTRQTYGNGQSIDCLYDAEGRVSAISLDRGKTFAFQYAYDADGVLQEVRDGLTQTRILYDGLKMQVMDLVDRELLYAIEYIDTNTVKMTIRGKSFDYHFHEEKKSNGNSAFRAIVTMPELAVTMQSVKDSLERLKYEKISTSQGTMMQIGYEYEDGQLAGVLVQDYSFNIEGRGEKTSTQWHYTYTPNGKVETISKEVENEKKQIYRFSYDEAGQLTRADDKCTGITTLYCYDSGGNLREKAEYPHSNGNLQGKALHVYRYEYADTNWKDKLTAFNSKEILYDAIGNPISSDGMDYEWGAGRQLSQITLENGIRVAYTYNEDGFRTSRAIFTAGSETPAVRYEYFWDQGRLLSQSIANMEAGGQERKNVVFLYSNTEEAPVGFTVDGEDTYLYEKNAQGDVLGVYREGLCVAQYAYDAFGNMTVCLEDEGYDSSLNPCYYRGYPLDRETGLYYLQSRYYVPQWGRFLNADLYVDTGTGLLGTNMFAYCDNDPINKTDASGYWAKEDHQSWTNEWLNGTVKSPYRTQIGEGAKDADTLFPAWVLPYQYIHFNRHKSRPSEDSRAEYAVEQLEKAFGDWVTAQGYANGSTQQKNHELWAMHAVGYAFHALQDTIAHGNIGIYDTIADHAIRPGLTTDPSKKTWGHADDPLYKWTGEDAYKLVWESGVTKTSSTRYNDTEAVTAVGMVVFILLIKDYNQSKFC